VNFMEEEFYTGKTDPVRSGERETRSMLVFAQPSLERNEGWGNPFPGFLKSVPSAGHSLG
jgi:hypothetical protein